MDGGHLGIPDKIGQTCVTLNRVFTNEALYTFFWKTECIISQRPLTTLSDEVNDFDTLTPNQFLMREAQLKQPPGEFSSKEINYPPKMESNSSSFQYFIGSLEKGISPYINSMERGIT